MLLKAVKIQGASIKKIFRAYADKKAFLSERLATIIRVYLARVYLNRRSRSQQLGSPDDTEIVDRINLCRMKTLKEGESNCWSCKQMLERVCRTAIQDIQASHERGCCSKECEDRTHTLSLTCVTHCPSQTSRE